jgi:hypothetical protein
MQETRMFIGFVAGAANRIRTCDPVITNDVLYQLSYCGIKDLARVALRLGAA